MSITAYGPQADAIRHLVASSPLAHVVTVTDIADGDQDGVRISKPEWRLSSGEELLWRAAYDIAYDDLPNVDHASRQAIHEALGVAWGVTPARALTTEAGL